MEITTGILLLMALAFLAAGVVDGISGGGGLISLPTFLLVGFPAHLISGTNMNSCLLGSVTSAYRYIRERKVHWPVAAIAGPMAGIGSFLGARLNLWLPERYLQIVMVVLIPLAAAAIFLKRNFGEENRVETLSLKRQRLLGFCIGFFIGVYNGFYGGGAGTFYLLAFAAFCRMDLVTASGSAKICGLFATVVAAVTYAISGVVLWKVSLTATVFNILGNYIGAGLAIRGGGRVIRPMFMAVLVLLFIRLIISVVL